MPRRARVLRVVLSVVTVFLVLSPVVCPASVIYVKYDAGGLSDGTTWIDAFSDLQSALSEAIAGDSIWVAEGTYRPTASTDRTISFVIPNGVGLFGGFNGSELDISERHIRRNGTILSGEIGISNGEDNSYHVVTLSGTDSTTVIDGITVTGGNASGSIPDDRGGGILCLGGNPVINNIVFKDSRAVWGGGIALSACTSVITNAGFFGNFAAFGGAMFNSNASRPIVTNATFASNSVQYQGAAVYNESSFPEYHNTIIWGNPGITQVINATGGVTNFFNSLVEGSGGSTAWNPVYGADGGNNIDEDPLYDVNFGMYRLSDVSPAIDIGDSGVANILEFDLDNKPRIAGSSIDLGAYEYNVLTGIDDAAVPTKLAPVAIRSVYPNPFNPTVAIDFGVERQTDVSVTIYDVRGKLIRDIASGTRNPGPHREVWNGVDNNGRRAASGVYFVEVRSHTISDRRKVVLLK